MKDRGFVQFLLDRIHALGCFAAIVVTCDHPHDRVRDYTVPVFDRDCDPTFVAERMTFANMAAWRAARLAKGCGDAVDPSENDFSLTWDDVAWLVSQTSLPVVCKGILTVHDAECALRAGARGIVVSNHGGRQLDGAPPAIEVASLCCNDNNNKKNNKNNDKKIEMTTRTAFLFLVSLPTK